MVSLTLTEPQTGELLQHPGGVEGAGVAVSPGVDDEPLAGGGQEGVHPWLQTGILSQVILLQDEPVFLQETGENHLHL